METVTFDTVTRIFGRSMTRRQALRGLVAGAAGLTGGGLLLQAEDAAAKRRRKRKRRGQNQNQNQNQGQGQDSTPQPDTCGVQGDGCGALDADTGAFTPPYCCHGYACVYSTSNGSSSWTCQALS